MTNQEILEQTNTIIWECSEYQRKPRGKELEILEQRTSRLNDLVDFSKREIEWISRHINGLHIKD